MYSLVDLTLHKKYQNSIEFFKISLTYRLTYPQSYQFKHYLKNLKGSGVGYLNIGGHTPNSSLSYYTP